MIIKNTRYNILYDTTMSSDPIPSTHENPKFREFIQSILERANLGDKYIKLFTDKSSMIEFTTAFTHKSVNPIDNYEFYEILGDATTNKVVVWYFIKRFPEIFKEGKGGGGNMSPVAIMARLKQNGVSKATYSKFSETLGFWDYIRRSEEVNKDRTKIMEDVFESFCGCLELLVDSKVTDHAGYGIVYRIMKTLMDPMKVSVDHDQLYDPKSRLNEIILSYKQRLTIEYEKIEDGIIRDPNDPETYKYRFQVKALILDKWNNKAYKSKVFYGATLRDAQQKAAKYVIESDMINKNIK